jgi:hypothetical protein
VELIEHPGCYGIPSAVSASCASCLTCPSRAGCVSEAYAILESLPDNPITQRERQTLTITRIALTEMPRARGRALIPTVVVATSRGRSRIVLCDQQLRQIALLPARVASQVRRLSETGWFSFAVSEMREGRNPATKGWQRVFCRALLAGGASRAALEMALVEQLSMTEASAQVQVSVGLSIFAFGRVATLQLGHFTLSQN